MKTEDLGKQHDMDDTFKQKARLHQSKFRAEILQEPCDIYGNMLAESAAKNGRNFYHGFGIFESVKERYPKYKKQLYANLLRSEHIPFNFFSPCLMNKKLFSKVIGSLLGKSIFIEKCFIEYAPEPPCDYLNDKTSFDVYIEYTVEGEGQSFLAIEVKFTERSYKIGKKEEQYCEDLNSPYHRLTRVSNVLRPDKVDEYKKDKFRQMWRNLLLAETYFSRNRERFQSFRTAILFPKNNDYLFQAVKQFTEIVIPSQREKFLAWTFEEFIDSIQSLHDSHEQMKWIEYLRSRYIL